MNIPISVQSSTCPFIHLCWKAYSNLLTRIIGFLTGIFVVLFWDVILQIRVLSGRWHFPSVWRMTCNISCSTDRLVMDYFNFCRSKSIFSQMAFLRMFWTLQCILIDVWGGDGGFLLVLSPDNYLLSSFWVFVHR